MRKEDFIGVWKLLKYGEGKIHTSQTHLIVKEDVLWEVYPGKIYYENQPGPEVKYVFEEGPFDEPSKVSLESGFKFLARRDGDTLLFKLGPIYGYFPKSFEDTGNVGEYKLENDENSELIGILPEKVKVEEFNLHGVGKFKYDGNMKWWTGRTSFQGGEITLDISVGREDKFERLNSVKLKLNQLESIPFNQIARQHLLSLLNESWNDNDQDITAEQFEKKISIESITLETDGESSVWINDGDLFLGHSIQISLDSENNVTDCDLAG